MREPYRARDARDRGAQPRRPVVPAVTTPTKCDVEVNMYKYEGQPMVLHMYAVTMTPEVHRNNMFGRFTQMVQGSDFKEVYAYDGGSMLVARNKFADVEIKVPLREGEQVVRIEYKHTYDMADANVDVSMLQQCMETILRYHQRMLFFVDKKRMFNERGEQLPIGNGLVVSPGLVSSVKLTGCGFCLNLDMAYGVFFKDGLLLDLVRDLAERRGRGRYGGAALPTAGSDFYEDFEQAIKNVRLTTIHRERNASFKASGIYNKAASSIEFEADGKTTTVAAYFAAAYGPLKHPDLPVVAVKKRDSTIFIPLEVCKVVPMQRYPRKLDEAMTSSMIKIAAKRPAERFAQIREKAAEIAALNNEVTQKFGMAFNGSMLNCKGLMLPPPKIAFLNTSVNVNNGSWNLVGVQAQSGVSIDKWRIFTFRPNDSVSNSTLRGFCDLARRYGVEIASNPETVSVRNISDFFQSEKARFNLVVLPDKSAQRYEEIKRIAETYHACFTQCVLSSNLGKLTNPSFVSNLLLKINAKLGGRNWLISSGLFSDKPTILFGIDVNHPGVGDLEDPSIVSVVASMDYNFVTYKTSITQQERRQEIVGNLRAVVKAMLKSHFAATRSKPARLVVFRDGVGDSMFDAVFATEIAAIRDACSDLSANYKPEITFIVAQKRHSVRFASKNQNLVPGTVVSELARPASGVSAATPLHDFYLVSHNALQGTARPVRYLVLLNESNFTSSYLYEAVYGLCHLYMRATKSVSVVPPIYYAHLAAARGKCYLERNESGELYMRKCDAEIEKSLYYL